MIAHSIFICILVLSGDVKIAECSNNKTSTNFDEKKQSIYILHEIWCKFYFTDDAFNWSQHALPVTDSNFMQPPPYFVTVRIMEVSHWCGGAILHKMWIITSAQCLVQ